MPLWLFMNEFGYIPSSQVSDWGTFGSFISGIYGTLAFFAVAYSLLITRMQFAKQNEDEIFYKTVDSLDSCVLNIESTISTQMENRASLFHITELIREEAMSYCANLTRKTMCKYPDVLTDQHWSRVLKPVASSHPTLSSVEYINNFREEFEALPNFNEKWEILKSELGGIKAEYAGVEKELHAVGSIVFYKVPFSERVDTYERVMASVENTYGVFLNRYKNTISFAMEHVKSSTNKKLYMKYFISKLTKYDILILYYISMATKDFDFIDLLIELDVISLVSRAECREMIIDWPSELEIKEDISQMSSKRSTHKMEMEELVAMVPGK